MLTQEILNAIDDIDTVVTESEINTCEALLNSYDKMNSIMEYYEGDDINVFTIFQEGVVDDVKKEMKETGKGKSTIMKILSALPRLIMALVHAFKKRKAKEDTSSTKEFAKQLSQTMKDSKKRKALMAIIFGTGTAAGAAITVNSVKKHRQKKAAEAEAERKRLEEVEKKLKEAKDLADKREALDRCVGTLRSFVSKIVPENIAYASKLMSYVPKDVSIEFHAALKECKDVMIEPSSRSIKKLSDTIRSIKDVEISDDIMALLKAADEAIPKNNDVIKEIDKVLKYLEDAAHKHSDILNGTARSKVNLRLAYHGNGIHNDDVLITGKSVWIFMVEDYLNKTLKAFKHFSTTTNITDDEKKILVEKTDFSSFGKAIPLWDALKLYSGDYIDRVTTIFTSIAEVDKKLVDWLNSSKDSGDSEYQKDIDLLNSMENELVRNPESFIKMFFDGFSNDFEPLLRTLKFFYPYDLTEFEEKGIRKEDYANTSKLYPADTETDSEGGVWIKGPGNASARSRKISKNT